MGVPIYREKFRLRSYETDPQGRLQIPILCQLLQEAATAHAERLGVAVETLAKRGMAWVLSRLHLNLIRWPHGDEEIVVETWPEAMNRLMVERRFSIFDGDDTRIGTVSTLWFVLDLTRRKPIRLPVEMAGRMDDYEIGSEPVRNSHLTIPDPADRELAFTVRRSDLDLARHVNNTSYVEWAVEAIPDDVWTTCHLADLDIQFVSECYQGHTVLSRSQLVDHGNETEARHQLVREEDGVEVARALSRWRRREEA
jgi:acyl-ACP thioesterase